MSKDLRAADKLRKVAYLEAHWACDGAYNDTYGWGNLRKPARETTSGATGVVSPVASDY